MALLKQGHAAAAENTFVQLIAAMPNHAAAYHFLGVAQAQQKRLSDARNAIAHATQLHPIHAAWYENLAHIEQALGNAAGASVATARARQLRAQMQTQMSGGSDGAPL